MAKIVCGTSSCLLSRTFALLCVWYWLCLNLAALVSSRSVLLVLVVGSMVENDGVSKEKKSTGEDDTDEWVNLDDLTDAELEDICTSRGFEIVRDGEENAVYTHQAYVEAAEQCLAIEAEIEKVLKENPDIKQQLLEEVANLEQRKLQLEEELDRVEVTAKTSNSQTLAFLKSSILPTINETEATSSSEVITPEVSVLAVEESTGTKEPEATSEAIRLDISVLAIEDESSGTKETEATSEAITPDSSVLAVEEESAGTKETKVTSEVIKPDLTILAIEESTVTKGDTTLITTTLQQPMREVKKRIAGMITVFSQLSFSGARMLLKYLRTTVGLLSNVIQETSTRNQGTDANASNNLLVL